MKNLASQGSLYRASSPSRSIAFIAMLLFAFSGLISGFAMAVFIRPHIALPSPSNTGTTSITQKTETQTPTGTMKSVPLGFPVIDDVTMSETADGNTGYAFSAHAVDQSIDKGHGKPIHSPGITCRLWIAPITQDLHNLPPDRLRSPDTLQSTPLPGEIQKLLFDATTPQTQPCNADGQGIWKYRIDPSIKHGYYYLVVLTDWKGLHYTWSWVTINIH